jgi:hypothetical protein
MLPKDVSPIRPPPIHPVTKNPQFLHTYPALVHIYDIELAIVVVVVMMMHAASK